MSNDLAELKLLSMHSERYKIAVQLGLALTPDLQMALERSIDEDWLKLVDVTPIAEHPNNLFRVFKVTDNGLYRLSVLKGERLN